MVPSSARWEHRPPRTAAGYNGPDQGFPEGEPSQPALVLKRSAFVFQAGEKKIWIPVYPAGLQGSGTAREGVFRTVLPGQGWGETVGKPAEPSLRAGPPGKPRGHGDEGQVFHLSAQDPAASHKVRGHSLTCVLVRVLPVISKH